jgi:hypothetical protein
MKYLLADHVSLTEVDDEAVLLDLNSGGYFGLNHVGARLMVHLNAQKSVEFAVADIVDHYQACATTVKQDIDVLIAQLLEQKLIFQA